ncbi:DUF4056 domain-containing protein [Agrococcus sp. DT81.2]|uniref:DUF4056 domain-containing protein n=1 Tax=Agrococcus sp. DT81.2 TaxID=3393414 RepID=UPI003CE58F7A
MMFHTTVVPDSTSIDSTSVPGPCADVVVTPAMRPALLIRGSVHPTVRDAQRRINAFHVAELAAGRAPIADAPLVPDCIFGRATERAILSFQQRVFPGMPKDHDGKIGPRTWAQFDRVAASSPAPPAPAPPPAPPFVPPAPPSPAMTGPRSIARPCCMLAQMSLAGAATGGGHSSSQPGVVYTGGAGFVDLGHLWEVADVTAFAYQQIHAGGGAVGTRVRANEGTAVLTAAAPAVEWLDLARCIAFDDAFGHEIATYTVMSPGGHNSSFSPEDLCSNFLGALVAARALTTGGNFATTAESKVRALLTSLDAQNDVETARAFGRISRRWVDVSLVLGVGRDSYLRRRNFTRDPWKTGHPSDVATPGFVTAPLSVTTTYDYVHKGGFSRADFAARVAAIRTDAAARYGPDFDTP